MVSYVFKIFYIIIMRFKLIILLVIGIIQILVSPSSHAIANGVIFNCEHEAPSLAPLKSGRYFISHIAGTQNMLISINLKGSFKKGRTIWILPIPAESHDIKINKIDSFPIFKKKTFNKAFDDEIERYFKYLYLSQLFTYPAYLLSEKGTTSTGLFHGDEAMLLTTQKYILRTELISAKHKSDFSSYLTQNNIKFTDDFNAIINEYIEKDYTFVISWLDCSKEFNNDLDSSAELSISFKTPDIFIPLKFSSIYNNLKIPIYISLNGFVNTYFSNNTLSGLSINYFVDNKFKYTQITFLSEANHLSQDLRIDPNKPINFSTKVFIYDYKELLFILLFATISIISSIFSARLNFADSKPSNLKFVLLGMLNIMSLAVLIPGAFFLKIDKTLLRGETIENQSSEEDKLNNLPVSFSDSMSLIFIMITMFLAFGFYSRNEIGMSLISLSCIIFGFLALFIIKIYENFFNNNNDKTGHMEKSKLSESFIINYSIVIAILIFLYIFGIHFIAGTLNLFYNRFTYCLGLIFAVFWFTCIFARIYYTIYTKSPAVAAFICNFSIIFIILTACFRSVLTVCN